MLDPTYFLDYSVIIVHFDLYENLLQVQCI